MAVPYTLREVKDNIKALEAKAEKHKSLDHKAQLKAAIRGLKQTEIYKKDAKNETT